MVLRTDEVREAGAKETTSFRHPLEAFGQLSPEVRLKLAAAYLDKTPTGKTKPGLTDCEFQDVGAPTHGHETGMHKPEQALVGISGPDTPVSQFDLACESLGLETSIGSPADSFFNSLALAEVRGIDLSGVSVQDLADPNSEFWRRIDEEDQERYRLSALYPDTFEGTPTLQELSHLLENRRGEDAATVEKMAGLFMSTLMAEAEAAENGNEVTFQRDRLQKAVEKLLSYI